MLLESEVKSTRTRWEEFRKKWKKDRRFFGWGKDDREREKVFKAHLREVGEKKRRHAEKAEKEFFELLAESKEVQKDSVWKEVCPCFSFGATSSRQQRHLLVDKF